MPDLKPYYLSQARTYFTRFDDFNPGYFFWHASQNEKFTTAQAREFIEIGQKYTPKTMFTGTINEAKIILDEAQYNEWRDFSTYIEMEVRNFLGQTQEPADFYIDKLVKSNFNKIAMHATFDQIQPYFTREVERMHSTKNAYARRPSPFKPRSPHVSPKYSDELSPVKTPQKSLDPEMLQKLENLTSHYAPRIDTSVTLQSLADRLRALGRKESPLVNEQVEMLRQAQKMKAVVLFKMFTNDREPLTKELYNYDDDYYQVNAGRVRSNPYASIYRFGDLESWFLSKKTTDPLTGQHAATIRKVRFRLPTFKETTAFKADRVREKTLAESRRRSFGGGRRKIPRTKRY